MIKSPKDILVMLLAVLCLIISLVFMPWSELGFNSHFPNWLAGVMQHLGVTHLFNGLAGHDKLMEIIKLDHATDNLNNYAYALFLCLAMCAAAIAIILIGKEENTEKTVLQAKK